MTEHTETMIINTSFGPAFVRKKYRIFTNQVIGGAPQSEIISIEMDAVWATIGQKKEYSDWVMGGCRQTGPLWVSRR